MDDTIKLSRDGGSSPFRCISAAQTDVGAVRKINEDAFLERPEIRLWAVADGLGGESAGDRASRMVIEALSRVSAPTSASAFLAEVREQLEAVNRMLRLEAQSVNADQIIASTVVAFLVHGEHFACAWAGDSRLYRLRNNVLHQISKDHSEVQDLIDAGLLDPSRASSHPNANMLTRAVGAADELQLDFCQDHLVEGDAFLLCSDGLTKMVSDSEIEAIFANRTPQEATTELMTTTLARGAIDNVTVVTIKIIADDSRGG